MGQRADRFVASTSAMAASASRADANTVRCVRDCTRYTDLVKLAGPAESAWCEMETQDELKATRVICGRSLQLRQLSERNDVRPAISQAIRSDRLDWARAGQGRNDRPRPVRADGCGAHLDVLRKGPGHHGARSRARVGHRRARHPERGLLAVDRRAANPRSRLHRPDRPRLVRGEAGNRYTDQDARAGCAAADDRPRRATAPTG